MQKEFRLSVVLSIITNCLLLESDEAEFDELLSFITETENRDPRFRLANIHVAQKVLLSQLEPKFQHLANDKCDDYALLLGGYAGEISIYKNEFNQCQKQNVEPQEWPRRADPQQKNHSPKWRQETWKKWAKEQEPIYGQEMVMVNEPDREWVRKQIQWLMAIY